MAMKFKKPSKKTTIALVVAIVILLIIAVTGTVAFLKDKGRTEAADLESTQQGDVTQSGEQDSNQPGEEVLNPEQGENQGQGENQEQITDIQNGEQAQEGQTTETNGTTGANNPNNGVTTQVDNIQETTIERVETVEIPEKQVSEGHYVGWTPMGLKAADASSKLNVNDSKDIEISKQAITNSGKNVVTRGEEITYTISVKNISNEDMTDVEVKDRIPEMTTYVETSADNSATEVVEDGKVIGLIWNLDLKAGEEITLSFKVTANSDATGVITNIAFANGEETEPVENTVIEATKTVVIEGKEDEDTAKVGDKLIYTITIKNTGNIEGTANVQDIKLKELIDNGILKVDEESQEIANKLTEGTTVDVPKNDEATISFKVEVLKIDGAIKNIVVVGEDEPEATVDTVNIEIKKDVKEIIRNGKEVVAEPVKVNDVINYQITVSNTGNASAKVDVIDEIQNSNLKLDLKDENGKVVTEITVEGKSQRILSATYAVIQEDINNQKDILNVARAVYDGDEKNDDAKTSVETERKDVLVEKQVKGETADVNLTAVKKDDVLVYSVKVTNNGNTTIDRVTITDEMLEIEDKEYTFTAINPGEYTIIELGKYTVQQEDINAQKPIKNTVLVNEKSDDVETPVETERKDVLVEKQVKGETADVNLAAVKKDDVLVYSVKVTNNGNTTIDRVTITDEMLEIEDKEYTFTAINPGEYTIIELGKYTVQQEDINAQKPIKNTVLVNGKTSEKETPVEKSNPIATIVKKAIQVEAVSTENGESTKFVDIDSDVPVYVLKGDKVRYSITIKNEGNITLTGLKVTDNKDVILDSITLADGTTLQADETVYTSYTAETNLLENVSNLKLEPQETIVLYVVHEISNTEATNKETFTNTAYVNTNELPDKIDSSDTVKIAQRPSIKVTKTVTAVNGGAIKEVTLGDIITYTIKVENTGNVDLTNIKIIDDRAVSLTSNGTPTTANTTNLSKVTSLPVGATTEITVYYKITEQDVLNQAVDRKFVNTATAQGKFGNSTVSDENSATVTQQVENPNITIKKTAPATVNAGSEMTYTITLTNTGYADGKVTVNDQLNDTNITYKPGTATENGIYVDTTRTLTWTDVVVPKKSSKTITFIVTVAKNSIGKTLSNTAIIANETGDGKTSSVETKVNCKKVNVEEYKEGQSGNSDVNIIFIMDTSSSMNDPIKGESYKSNDDYNTFVAASDISKTRLYNAKSAITTFVNSIYNNAELSNTNMSFITFNGKDYDANIYTLGDEYTSKNVSVNDENMNTKNKYVKASDGKYYYYTSKSIKAETKVITQKVNKTNYSNLITAVNNIDIGVRNSGLGTQINDALSNAKTLIDNYKASSKNRNVVIVLGDGDISDITLKNGTINNSNLSALKTAADEIYTIGFGKDATDNTKNAYKKLKAISTTNSVYTAENSSELVKQFQDIMSSLNNSKEYTTGTGINGIIDGGTIEFKASDLLIVTQNSPFMILNGESEIVKYTDISQLNSNTDGVTYNSTTKTIQWNINTYLTNNPNVTLGDITIKYFIPYSK